MFASSQMLERRTLRRAAVADIVDADAIQSEIVSAPIVASGNARIVPGRRNAGRQREQPVDRSGRQRQLGDLLLPKDLPMVWLSVWIRRRLADHFDRLLHSARLQRKILPNSLRRKKLDILHLYRLEAVFLGANLIHAGQQVRAPCTIRSTHRGVYRSSRPLIQYRYHRTGRSRSRRSRLTYPTIDPAMFCAMP